MKANAAAYPRRNQRIGRPSRSLPAVAVLARMAALPASTGAIRTGVASVPGSQPRVGDTAAGGRADIDLLHGDMPTAGSFVDIFTGLDIVDGAVAYERPAPTAGQSGSHALVALEGGREALRLGVDGVAIVPRPGTPAPRIAGVLAGGCVGSAARAEPPVRAAWSGQNGLHR